MQTRLLIALCKTDLRQLVRDPVLLVGALLPVILGLLLRFALPAGLLALDSVAPSFDPTPHLPTLTIGAMIISVMMSGWLVGFLLIEDRQQHMLTVLGVTPLTRGGFLRWRLALPAIIAALGNLAVLGIGQVGIVDPARALASVALLMLTAPGFALALAAFADNEVEGLALAKFGGLVFMLPLLSPYLDGPWAWALGVLPPCWAVRLFVGGPWWLLVPGVAVSSAWLLWFMRKFAARSD